jgi:hypothetical protein
VVIDNIHINTYFFDDSEIENDIDPAEFVSIDCHEKLIRYMQGISWLLNKEVILTPENEQETVLIKVDKDNIHYQKLVKLSPFKRLIKNIFSGR